MRGLSISRLMLKSWLRMLYRENIGFHQLEVSSIRSDEARSIVMCT